MENKWNASVEEYRAYPALNFHTLLNFSRDPKAYREGFFDSTPENDAMRFGTALHARILGGYDDAVASFQPPVNEKTGAPYGATTKAYQEAYAAFAKENVGKTLIDERDAETIEKLYTEYQFHSDAPRIVAGDWGYSELPVRGVIATEEGDVEVKGLIDRYSSAGLIDLKTTATLDDGYGRDRFRYAIYDRKYLVQLAFYHMILCDCLGESWAPCWIIAFERTQPNRIAVYSITDMVIENAREVVVAWLKAWQRAQKSGAYTSRYYGVRFIDTYDKLRDI